MKNILVICSKEDCMYNRIYRSKDKLNKDYFYCGADIIGIKEDLTCDSYLEVEELSKKK